MRTTPNLRKIDDHVAVRLRAGRNLAGLSQDEAANSIGITFQQIQKYENGMNRISAAKLAWLAKSYGVAIEWLFEGAPGLNGNGHITIDWGSELTRLPDGPALAQALSSLSRERRDLILALALQMS